MQILRPKVARRSRRSQQTCCVSSLIPALFCTAGRLRISPSTKRKSSLRRLLIITAVANAILFDGTKARAAPAMETPSSAHVEATEIAPVIMAAARRFTIPASWIRAVIRAESDGFVHAVSPKGALGLMQLMPATWAAMQQRYHLGDDPFDPRDNIFAGAAYIRALLDRFGMAGFLAAYNAGPLRWEEHVATGIPLPAGTRAYVTELAPIIDGIRTGRPIFVPFKARSWIDETLFTVQRKRKPGGNSPTSTLQSAGHFQSGHATKVGVLKPSSNGLFVAISASGRSR